MKTAKLHAERRDIMSGWCIPCTGTSPQIVWGPMDPWSWHYLNHLNNRVWHLICRGQFITTIRRKYFPVIFSSHRVDIYFVHGTWNKVRPRIMGTWQQYPGITRRDFLMPSSDYVYEACSYVCSEILTWYSRYNSQQQHFSPTLWTTPQRSSKNSRPIL